MLGPALSQLLEAVRRIPEPARTPEQQAQYEELSTLDRQLPGLIISEDLGDYGPLSVTRPKPRGTKLKNCPRCGEPLDE